MRLFNILAISLIFSVICGCSKSNHYVELINQIIAERDGGGEFSDSQIERIFKVIEENPQTLDCDLSFVDPINITTSDDGNVRSYSIERCGFGGNPSAGYEIFNLIQYRIGNTVKVATFHDDFAVIKSITHLENNKYLVIDEIAISHQSSYVTMTAKVIVLKPQGVTIDRKAFIDGNETSAELTVSWEEDDMEGDYIADGMRANLDENEDLSDRMLYYNEFTEELFVNTTMLTINGHSHVATTYDRYKWENGAFHNITIAKPFEAYNEDYYIRIDQLPDGSCVYRCWNGGKKIGSPNLTIRGGQRAIDYGYSLCIYNEWTSYRDVTPTYGEEYIFENNGYSYRFYDGRDGGHDGSRLTIHSPDGRYLYEKTFEIIEN